MSINNSRNKVDDDTTNISKLSGKATDGACYPSLCSTQGITTCWCCLSLIITECYRSHSECNNEC